MFTTPPPNIAYLNYTPSRLQSIIGEANYHHMLSENNKYLTALNTILIKGIDNKMLNLTITPPNTKHLNKQVSI